MSETIIIEDTSSDDSDYYDNFNNMKAKIAKRQRKVQEIQAKFDKLDAPFTENNNKETGEDANAKSNEDPDVISDDDLLLLNDSSTIQPNGHGLGRCSPSNSIILDSDSSSSESADENRDEQFTSNSVLKERNAPVRNTCTIRIYSNGNAKIFIHELDESIKCLIDEFAERTNCDPKRIILVTKSTLKRCDPKETPRILGFPEGVITELDVFENIEEDDSKMIKIKYQMKGKKIISAKVLQNMPFSRLKELFCAENNLNPAKVKFIFDSFPLKDTDTPLTAEMENDDTIDVYLV